MNVIVTAELMVIEDSINLTDYAEAEIKTINDSLIICLRSW